MSFVPCVFVKRCHTCISSQQQVLFSFLCALCSYQINARTELAIRYNDMSPLENHHCAVAFQILGDPETNILSNMTSEHYKTVRMVSGCCHGNGSVLHSIAHCLAVTLCSLEVPCPPLLSPPTSPPPPLPLSSNLPSPSPLTSHFSHHVCM